MNPHLLTSQNVNFGIALSRDNIINKFLLASSVFGVIYLAVTIWRDLSVGMVSTNSTVNFITTAIPTILWLIRNRITYSTKAVLLFVTFLVSGIKSVVLFGTYSNSMIMFFCFCCIILAGSLNLKLSFIVMLVLSLIIPLRGYLHVAGIFPIGINSLQIVSDKPASWVQLYITFFVMASIITLGVGQLRTEVYKYIALLQNSIRELEAMNDKLTNEIRIKNILQENLIVSSQKFRSLFESSRDSVILLNNEGHVVEANPAACDLSGYSLQELQGTSIFRLVDVPYRKAMIRNFTMQIEGSQQTAITEITFITRNGSTLPVEINSNLILTEDQVMMLSTIRNVSFRKQAENEKFNAVLAAEERERERFSKDLHDDLGPVFSTVNLYLQTLNNKEIDSSKKGILEKLIGIVDSAIKQVREISHNLSPYLLRDAGIEKAIATHLARIKESTNLTTEFTSAFESEQRIPSNVEIVIYRVFLELLNNTIKHSGGDKVWITMRMASQKLQFTYTDNGRGFDVHKMREERLGIGLLNIDNRVKSMAGIIRYRYENNEMKVTITIPV
ncbi:PAS domain S-box protein [Chryseolinea sp. T2]|uniref:PAS domain-containing sensor histidine kinase n=1 Tax=Chryseolinea sp. T2 TaxID=3129255 RepID=UPI00307709FB